MNITERFLKYVSFETTSYEDEPGCPSSEKQLELAKYLAGELKDIGLEDARMDKHGYVYASLPASEGCEDEPAIGFIAHMDTSSAVSGANIRPRTVRYEGGDIELGGGVFIRESAFESLAGYTGQDLIVTDGTTLLGADDKAGIAEIVTAMEFLKAHPQIKHGPISIGFTPDEEIGRGADLFDIKGFGAQFAYTVDGGPLGELEYENFNAASAKIRVNGVSIHPGSAKNKMKNSVLIASELLGMLPAAEAPAHTEDYEGFYHVCDIAGDETLTKMTVIIRDHDMEKFKARKALLESICAFLNEKHGQKTVCMDLKDSYYNMKEKILPVMHVVERAEKAMKDAGVEPAVRPIRGGTDGARLSFEGLPCPNISTGGENFHGVHEFVSIRAMEKMVEVIVNIAACERR